MKHVRAFLFVTVLGIANGIQLSSHPLPQDVAKKLLQQRWSPVGKSSHKTRPSIYRNTLATVEQDTPMGRVRGIVTETCRNATSYGAFFGMPYAKPPVGELRFMSPVPAEPWSDTYDATYERQSCMQFTGQSSRESEDCLYINVYTPNYALNQKPLAVMVFIHGGAFIQGSSNSSLYSPDFIVEKGLILVTFNYRLGVLGFLSLQNEAVPGNAGLKDQALALKWVQDNIEAFGGDPKRVTIFGESAGSASVNYHLFSEMSKGLFQRAIMQSGTSNTPWAYVPSHETKRLAHNLAEKLGCNVQTSQAVLNCLQGISARTLVDKQQGILTIEDLLSIRPFAFVPTDEPNVRGAFLTDSPQNLLLQNKFNAVPMIIGSNSREGLIALPALKLSDPLGLAMSLLNLDLTMFFPYQIKDELPMITRMYVHKEVKKFYFGSKAIGLETRGKLINLITDTAFIIPIQQAAALMANSSAPVYDYSFTYDGPYNFFKKKLDVKNEEGVCHGDELGYLFYDEDLHPSYRNGNKSKSAEAEGMIDVMTSLWTNFAKTGYPTSESGDLELTQWKPRKLRDLVYMDIGNTLQLKKNLEPDLQQRVRFWFDLVKSVGPHD